MLNLGLQSPVLTVAGTPGQILINGQYAAVNGNVVVGLDGAISGATGFYAVLTGMSGALVTQIQSAAGVLSLNGATGLLTLTSAPANANYVKVTTSGTTIMVSGDTTPQLSGVLFAGGTTLSGNGGATYHNGDLVITRFAANGNGLNVQAANGGAGNQPSIGGYGSPTFISSDFAAWLFGATTNANNGRLQLATHTTSGNGIGLGPDNSIWRTAANQATYNGTLNLTGLLMPGGGRISGDGGNLFAASPQLQVRGVGGGTTISALDSTVNTVVRSVAGSSVGVLGTISNHGVVFQVNNTTALTVETTLDGLWARNLRAASGLFFADTGNYTVSGAASVAQLLAASGWLTNASTSNVVYTTGAQTITGAKSWNGGTFYNNVGMGGLTTPTAALGIKGTGYRGGIVLQQPNSSADRGFLYVSSGGVGGGNQDEVYLDLANTALHLRAGSAGTSEFLTTTVAGYVGLGVTAPLAQFHVTGSTLLATTAGGLVGIGITTPGSDLEILQRQVKGISVISSTAQPAIQLSTSGTAFASRIDFLTSGVTATKWSLIKDYGQIGGDTFDYEYAGTTRVMTLAGATSRVGIGTSTPGQALEVNGNVKLNPTADTSGGFLQAFNYNSDLGYTLAVVGPRPLILTTNNTERVRVTSAGLVGIGTTTPAQLLHVSGGNVQIHNTQVGLTLTSTNGAANGQASINIVNSAGTFRIARDIAGGGSQFVGGGAIGSAAQIGTREATSLQLFTNDTARVSVRDDGTVGIGTTGALALLHVSGGNLRVDGNGLITGGKLTIGLTNSTEDSLEIVGNVGAAPKFRISSSSSSASARNWGIATDFDVLGGLSFRTSTGVGFSPFTAGTTPLYLSSAGNVGVGTTAPAERCHVSGGNLRVDGILNISGITLTPTSATQLQMLNGVNFNLGGTTLLTADAFYRTTTTNSLSVYSDGAATAGISAYGPAMAKSSTLELLAGSGIAVSIASTKVATFASGLILGTSNVTGGGISYGGDVYTSRAGLGTYHIESTGTAGVLVRVRSAAGRNIEINQSETSTPCGKINTAGWSVGQIFRIGTEHNGPMEFETNSIIAATFDVSQNLGVTGAVTAKSYRAAVSGSAIPTTAAGTGRYTVNFTSDPGLLTTTITGLTIFSGSNYVAGGAATVRINVSGSNAVAIAFPSTWNPVSTIPTGLATGRFAILTLNTFTANDSGVCYAWAVQP